MRAFLAAVVLLTSSTVYAEGDSRCLGGILPEGRGIQFCYAQEMEDGWFVLRSEMADTGLMIVEFVIKKGKRARFYVDLYDRREGESIRKASRILSVLLGLPRLRKTAAGYRLRARRRRNRKVVEVMRFRDDRFFVVIRYRRKLTRSGRKALLEFLGGLETYYSEIE